MSREAFEAVQDHTKADHYGRNVLYAIARFTPPAGGEVQMTLRTLSDLSGCDKDTVSNRAAWLVENGELATRKEGAGRGTKIFYTILLPFNKPRYESGLLSDETPETTDHWSDNKTTDGTQLLSDQIKLLSDQIKLLSDQLRLMTDGTTDNVRLTSNTNTIAPDLKHQEHQENPPTPLVPSEPDNPFPFRPAGQNKDITPADARVAAIIRVCGLDMTVPSHVTQAQNAAAQLSSYTAAVILDRYSRPAPGAIPKSWNWWTDDWRGRDKNDAPRPAQVVETISQERKAPIGAMSSNALPRMSRAEQGALEVAEILQEWNES